MTKRWALLAAVLLVAMMALGDWLMFALADGGQIQDVWSVQVTILSACRPTGVPVGIPSIIMFTRDGKVIEFRARCWSGRCRSCV